MSGCLDARHVAHFTKKRRARTRSRCAQIVGNNHSPHRNTRTSSASVGWGQLQRWLIIFMWVRHYERPLYSHFNNCYYKICISAALKKCSFNNSGPLLTYESPFGNNWSRTVLKPCCLNMLLAPTCLKTSFFFFFYPCIIHYSISVPQHLSLLTCTAYLFYDVSRESIFIKLIFHYFIQMIKKGEGKKRGSAWCVADTDKHDQFTERTQSLSVS